MDREPKLKRRYTRRDFLRVAPMAMAAGIAMSVFTRRLLGRRRKAPVFPEGSIFEPAEDPRNRA